MQIRLNNRFQMQSFPTIKWGVLKNFVNSSGKHLFVIKLQSSCNSIEKKLQYSSFPVKFAKFLITLFLQKSSSGCFWGVSRVFEGAKAGVTVSNKYQIHLKKKNYLLQRKCCSSNDKCSVKEGLQGPAQVFSCEYCEMFK